MTTARKTLLVVIFFTCIELSADQKPRLFLNGPSYSHHFGNVWPGVRDFHLGLGGELVWIKKRFLYGLNVHYMFNDSLNRPAYWAGIVAGLHLETHSGFWGEAFAIAGILKKQEYFGGRPSLFALPVISAGWRFVGVNLALLPPVSDNTFWIFFVQIKIRIL